MTGEVQMNFVEDTVNVTSDGVILPKHFWNSDTSTEQTSDIPINMYRCLLHYAEYQ
jgi:hypothetical protein